MGGVEKNNGPVLLGVVMLGLIALLCTFALIRLSGQPNPPVGSAADETTDLQAGDEGNTSDTAAGPVAVDVAGDTGTIGLLGQIVGVLGTIAAAAVGGISGLLVGPRLSGNNEASGAGAGGAGAGGAGGAGAGGG